MIGGALCSEITVSMAEPSVSILMVRAGPAGVRMRNTASLTGLALTLRPQPTVLAEMSSGSVEVLPAMVW